IGTIRHARDAAGSARDLAFLLARYRVAQANITDGPIVVEAAAATGEGLTVRAIGQAQDVDAVLLALPALLAGGGITRHQDGAWGRNARLQMSDWWVLSRGTNVSSSAWPSRWTWDHSQLRRFEGQP